jgi:hypothetical protein
MVPSGSVIQFLHDLERRQRFELAEAHQLAARQGVVIVLERITRAPDSIEEHGLGTRLSPGLFVISIPKPCFHLLEVDGEIPNADTDTAPGMVAILARVGGVFQKVLDLGCDMYENHNAEDLVEFSALT